MRDLEFSVIVPAFAGPSEIEGCLDALARLHAPAGGFEVVMVDDGSPEPADPGFGSGKTSPATCSILHCIDRSSSASRSCCASISSTTERS
jgi:hypothetical protein